MISYLVVRKIWTDNNNFKALAVNKTNELIWKNEWMCFDFFFCSQQEMNFSILSCHVHAKRSMCVDIFREINPMKLLIIRKRIDDRIHSLLFASLGHMLAYVYSIIDYVMIVVTNHVDWNDIKRIIKLRIICSNLFANTNPFLCVTFLALDLAAPQKFAVTFIVAMLLRHVISSATAHGRATSAACARSIAFPANSSCKWFTLNKI